MINNNLHSNLAIPPGEFLLEVIEDLGMSKDELAKRMNRPAAKLTAIFNGSKAITPDTALQLEKVTGVPAHIWNGLESDYRLTLARINQQKEQAKLKEEAGLVTKYCYNELKKLGLVENKTKPADKVLELHKYFGVTSLYNIQSVKRYAPLYRQNITKKNKVSSEALASWLRLGELKAQKINCRSFDYNKLKLLLPEIRGLTLLPPEKFQPVLETKLAEAGVALVVVPHLPKTCAHGAAFWLNQNKTIIMLTIRGSWADMFWFSLFHELGHILLHNKSSVFIESDSDDFIIQKHEDDADKFAADNLIPPSQYKIFINGKSFYKSDIKTFAKEMNIHTGVIVGRLQHENRIDKSWHNDLRLQYKWSK
jgi:HTH-type transcriptional regulator/antitoxin HigA